ncbi:MAG: hypothetical protein ABIC18_04905 [Candidatus Omnitrophota bacterium]
MLALGGQAKNTLCFIKADTAFISPLHTDLSNPVDFARFKRDVRYFLNKNPKVIAYDLHPEYQSSKYARELSAFGMYLQPVQHHHAHIASCMAENGLNNKQVIGIAFDGTGLGDDGALWGGEFLLSNYKNYTRIACLRQVPLIGAEGAIREPYRIASAWLYFLYKDRFLNLDIGLTNKINKNNWKVLKKMLLSGLNSPPASSMGRLFDAAASLILGKASANFEGELAIELEKKASAFNLSEHAYRFGIRKAGDKYIIEPGPIFKQIVKDLRTGMAKERIAYRFHLSVAKMIIKMSVILSKASGIKTIVLSGGVFQNRILLDTSRAGLEEKGFRVFTHDILSSSDAGLSLGQAAVAGFINGG